MKITKKSYPSPKGEIDIYTLTNASGASVDLSTLGAGIKAVRVPDAEGKIENVALSYENPADYIADGPCAGKIPGRFANRIANACFTLDGVEYHLAANCSGGNALHGGPEGFQNQIWKARETADGVIFSYHSADGEEGYPGNLDVEAEYKWSDDNVLSLHITARTDKATVINLTNHAYWNLSGADAGSILDHKIRMKASHWLPTSSELIPTGEIASVEGTPMDFRLIKEIGRDIKADFDALKFGKGYDNCWVIDREAPGITEAIELIDDKSGRTLTVSSDQPAFQVYTGNWLAGSPKNMSGRSYEDYDGVAIEMQGMPDAPNKPQFPGAVLRPGETYDRTIRFAFSTE